MPPEVLQRLASNGTPQVLGDPGVLHKNRRIARAVTCRHVFGWEVRLLVGAHLEVVQTQVYRTQDEVLSTGEQWNAAMADKGWR